MSAAVVIAVVVVTIVLLSLAGVGLYLVLRKKDENGNGGLIPLNPFFPLWPMNRKIPAIRLEALALPVVPIVKGGGCLSLTGDAHCPPVNDDCMDHIPFPITVPASWLTAYILGFPHYTSSTNNSIGPMMYFIPWNPVDVVGNNLDQDAMWLMMLVDGSDEKDYPFRYPVLFTGLNPAITNDAQAVQEYGPGWSYDTGGAQYTVPPYNKEIDTSAFTKDVILNALLSVLGPHNPAYAKSNGWIVVGYTNMVFYDAKDGSRQEVLCNYSCSIKGLNNGAGVFYFDQVRKDLGLPLSTDKMSPPFSSGQKCECKCGGPQNLCIDTCTLRPCSPELAQQQAGPPPCRCYCVSPGMCIDTCTQKQCT
jgi:hypothetical protein